MIVLGESHLRRAVTAYARHYHTERNHQGLGSELVIRSETTATATGPVKHHKRLAGLLEYCCREAARGRLLARLAETRPLAEARGSPSVVSFRREAA